MTTNGAEHAWDNVAKLEQLRRSFKAPRNAAWQVEKQPESNSAGATEIGDRPRRNGADQSPARIADAGHSSPGAGVVSPVGSSY